MPKQTTERIIDRPYSTKSGSGGGTAVSGSATSIPTHSLSGGYHSGTLSDSQAPQFALLNGTRAFTGNISFSGAQTVDGVDISTFYSAYLTHNHDDRYYTETESDAKYALLTRNMIAGNGLTGTGTLAADVTFHVGVANTGAAGLTVEADAIRLTSSSNPGAAASILATSASGAVTINNGGSTTQPAITVGDGNTGRLAVGASGWLDDGTQFRMLGSRNFYVPAVAEAKVEATSVVLGAAAGSTASFRASTLTGDAWSVSSAGVATFADNTNTGHLFGMAKIGNLGISNAAAFGHRTAGATTYAFRQGASYSSYFNAGAGQYIYFRVGDVDNMVLLPDGLRFEANKYVKSTGYTSGFAGSGWNIDQNISFTGETFAEFDNLSIRGTMRVYELLINQIRATNGTEIVSSVGKIGSVTGSTWEFEDPESSNLCPFAVDDLVIIQDVDVNSTTIVKRIVRRITSVTGKSVTVTAAAGGPTDVGAPTKGDAVVRFGNSTDTARQGVVLITSDFANAPYMDVIYGVASWADWTGGTKTKLRLGKLTGITSTANEYGLIVGQNGFTSSDSYIKAGTAGVVLNKSELKSYNGASQTISLQPDGDVFFGSNVAAVATTSFAHFGAAQTYNSESMGVGDLVIGNHAAGNTFWDASTGRLNFRTGTTVEAYISSAGVLSAGGGAVRLNSGGIEIDSPSSSISTELNSFKFKVGSTTVANLYANYLGGTSWAGFGISHSGNDTEIDIGAFADSSHKATFSISAASTKTAAEDVQIRGVSDSTSYVWIYDVDYLKIAQGANEIVFTNYYGAHATDHISEISNDIATYKALMLLGNKAYDTTTRRVNIYDHLFVNTRIKVGSDTIIDENLGSYLGQAASTASAISLANSSWGNAAHIGFNAYMASVAGSYDASGAWKFLGTQYTGDVTRPAIMTWDGNSGLFKFYIGEAGLAASADITTLTKTLQFGISSGNQVLGFMNTSPVAKQTVTGSRGGNAALASLLTAMANFGLITNSTTA